MKKKAITVKKTASVKGSADDLAPLLAEVRNLIQTARRGVSSVIDTFQVLTNFEIGRRIVLHEQKGAKRAAYGLEMLKALSTRLSEEFGRGFSVTNLQLMRNFFVLYKKRIQQQPAAKFHNPFTLSWTHYVELLPIKDPDERVRYSESDLEFAIITHLEKFLLELGKGFLFEARQKRFTFEGDHYFLDLVFYNRLLRCYLVIDLKLGKLTHQDLGQMQMYVNYYDRHVKRRDENPTIGLLLCKEKKDAVVKLTLPSDANIHAKEYQLYLPSKELLKAKLLEWVRDEEAMS